VAVEVTALRRGGQNIAPGPAVLLAAGDVVVLRGDSEAVSRAEERLL
jgi:CPA2 family monovalent cation:H+ antiporter-2